MDSLNANVLLSSQMVEKAIKNRLEGQKWLSRFEKHFAHTKNQNVYKVDSLNANVLLSLQMVENKEPFGR